MNDHPAHFKYRAFISYSHRDERWAAWLHKSLERYRVPRRLVGRATPMGNVPARIAPVFRDREELPTAVDLGRVVNAALGQSAVLIVICSPAAAQSRWVNEEIRAFQRLGKPDGIFCLIVDGEPNAGDARECFPEALRRRLDGEASDGAKPPEPIGADVRPGKDRPRLALLKVIAGLLGIGLDELARRELQRRNRRLAAISAASVAGMAAASVLATLALIARNEAEEQRARAEVEAATARETSDFLVGLFEVVDPSEARGNTITAREILDKGVMAIETKLADQPAVQGRLTFTMGSVYRSLGLYPSSAALFERSVATRRVLASDPEELGESLLYLGIVKTDLGDVAGAESVLEEALALYTATFGDASLGVAQVLEYQSQLAHSRQDYAKAESLARQSLAILDATTQPYPEEMRAIRLNSLSMAIQQGRAAHAEAKIYLREALDITRRVLDAGHPRVAQAANNLAMAHYRAGEFAEAEPLMREALERNRVIFGSAHPEVITTLNNLALLLGDTGRHSDANSIWAEVSAADVERFGPDHPQTAQTLVSWGNSLLRAGDVEVAESKLRRAIEILSMHVPSDSWQLSAPRSILALCLIPQRRFGEAETLLRQAYDALLTQFEASHPRVQRVIERTAALYEAWDRPADAREWRTRLVAPQ
jgi:tetratricopeptide (TPR) repeat protein